MVARTPTGARLRVIGAAAPAIFIAHVLEEGPGFVDWFNAHVARGITPELFWTVNLTGLVITLLVSLVVWGAPSAGSDGLVLGWLTFLFGANAVLHIVGAIADRGYVPGLVTAIVLYVPFYALLVREVYRAGRLGAVPMALVAIPAASPMLAHGYLIIFRGSRLF